MTIQKYLAFVKTVEYGSFTRAAEFLHCTQPGISHMIRDLESEWGVTLLERDRTGVRTTSDGMKLLGRAREVCDAHARLQTGVDELRGVQSGLIRIGTLSSVGTHWLPHMIKRFQQDYPNIEYELLLGDYVEIEEWILDGSVDCGFLRLPAKAGLETVFLENDRLLAVLPEKHSLARRRRFPVKQLAEEPFLLLEKSAKNEIADIFSKHGLKPDIRFKTWDDYTIMAMVEKGLGIAVLPELILRRVPYKIVTRELDIAAHRQIGFAVRDGKSAPVAVKRFMEYLDVRG